MTSWGGRWGVAVITAMALLCAIPAAPVRAEEPNAEDDQKARELFRLAESHYAAGRYEKAVVLYDESYQLSGRADILLAIANTYERMGEYKQAIARLRDYLKHPRARNVPSLRDRLRRLEAAEDQREAERDRVRQLEIAEQERTSELNRIRDQRDREPAVEVAPPKPAEPRRWPIYALLGGGAVGLGGAVWFGVLSNQAGSDAQAECGGSGLCLASVQDALDRELKWALLADMSAVVGIGATAAGAYLLWKRRGESREIRSAVVVGPALVPGGLGVSLAGEL